MSQSLVSRPDAAAEQSLLQRLTGDVAEIMVRGVLVFVLERAAPQGQFVVRLVACEEVCSSLAHQCLGESVAAPPHSVAQKLGGSGLGFKLLSV